MLEKIQETASYILEKTAFKAEIGIILGTGLGELANEIKAEYVLSYSDIPNFPISTVEGHTGKLILGKLSGKNVIAMQGRFHFYEGYSIEKVTFPVKVMKLLGIQKLFVSNASGGVNPDYKVGDLMVLSDHINLIPNPLIGKNIDELGPRFPDMSKPYDERLIDQAISIAKANNYRIHKGVYVAVTGPCLETPAEYMYIRNIGADAVGMSTVPEVIAARHMGIPCFGVSVITDLGVLGKIVEVTHEDVQKVASKAELILTKMVKQLFERL